MLQELAVLSWWAPRLPGQRTLLLPKEERLWDEGAG